MGRRYGPLTVASECRWLSAGEAAYSVLFGLFIPRKGFVWDSTISAELQMYEEEWLVEHMDVHHFDSTGLRYQGRSIELFMVQPAGIGPIDLPSNGIQFGNHRIVLERPVHVNHGVGFRYATPAFSATDGIQLTVLYRRVSNG